jgi:hypothetical protein
MTLTNVIHNLKTSRTKNFNSDGITIDSSDEHENAHDSIRANREFDSNESDESHSQLEKQDEQRTSTFDGIKID